MHSLLKELNLASLSELTRRKRNNMNIFWIRRVCSVNPKRNIGVRSWKSSVMWPVIHRCSLSSSFSVEAARFMENKVARTSIWGII
jgi:hypothetical protein